MVQYNNIQVNYVWLVINVYPMKDDIVSIWTTEEMAKAAILIHESEARPLHRRYEVKKWQLNVTIPQWD